jgi:hypothetical protein
MSTNLIINQNTNKKQDTCKYQNFNNNKIIDYNLQPPVIDNENKNSYIDSTNIIGMIQSNNYDMNGSNIDNDTNLRNGKLRDDKSRK